MLLSYVWIIMVILSIFCSILTGRTALFLFYYETLYTVIPVFV